MGEQKCAIRCSGITKRFGSVVANDGIELDVQYGEILALLGENRRKLDEIAQYLYEKETISGEEFMRILNAQPQLPASAPADSTKQES